MKTKLLALFVLSTSFANAQTMAGSLGHSLFICSDGTVSSCGFNPDGQLGDGTTTNSLTYVPVAGLSGITQVSAGVSYGHSLFVKNDGTAWACGPNNNYQLGTGTTVSSAVPVQVSGLSNVIAVSTGESHSLFLKSDSTVWGCGSNFKGQVAEPASVLQSSAVVPIDSLRGIIAIAAGYNHSLFLKSNGTVWACGDNTHGELGDGTFANSRFSPVQVSGITDVVAIAAGGQHSLFLKSDGTVWGCGWNGGEMGFGTSVDAHVPMQVLGLTDITAISGGAVHFLYLKSDSTVWACGSNVSGQLGNGSTTGVIAAFQIPALHGVEAISAGGYHSLFKKYDGSVWGCGFNTSGQLGLGTASNVNVPTELVNLCSSVGIAENTIQAGLSVYPNPFSSTATIHLDKRYTRATIAVYNSTGQKVKEIAAGAAQEITLQRDELQSGLYFIRLTEDDVAVAVGKLMIAD